MAFGIDDALSAAAGGISLTDTVVQIVKAYRKRGEDIDIERLIEEVRLAALKRIDEADGALVGFERTLRERDVDVNKTLHDVIDSAPFWPPYVQFRLKRFRQSFNALSDATYSGVDDIASLVRCRDRTKPMGQAIVDSAKMKHELHSRLINAKSVMEAIDLLRNELDRQKAALQ